MVDPLTMLALVGFIGLATYFFEIQIRNSMLARSFAFNTGWVFQGTHLYFTITNTKTPKNLLIKAKLPKKLQIRVNQPPEGSTNSKDQ